MTIELIKEMMDACFFAKRVRDLLPALPDGVLPSQIRYLDVIQRLERSGMRAKVSDLSSVLNLPRPGVTRAIKELEQKGYLRKENSPEDGRVTYLSLSESGKLLSQKYNHDTFQALLPNLQEISDQDAECMIRVIKALYQAMQQQFETK